MSEERKPLQVMLTDEQRETLDAAARERGLPTSTWIRLVALETAKDGPKGGRLREALKAALEAEEG